ncbi:ATP-binding cassette domain-containing protein [Streptosporangium sp. NPDC000396]|uniref:ATP-binding cassette domain-containing protein n=1 Tax=Streptosporangium sp. NPDC000396 TaxID=3366185 RepID=UPI0036855169
MYVRVLRRAVRDGRRRGQAGKSTLVKLLCRFYDPTRGAILWDGVDIRLHGGRQGEPRDGSGALRGAVAAARAGSCLPARPA